MNKQLDYLGFGLGLRPEFYQEIIETTPKDIQWFEIITENYLNAAAKPLFYLEKIRENYPLVMHGVSLSIGSCDPIHWDYLAKVKALAQRFEVKWISDHLCWTGVNKVNMHDLMPLPYTKESLKHVVDRVKQVQDFLGRQILLENVSSYINYNASLMSEAEFYVEVAKQADCLLLLDVNNVYVSAYNQDFDPQSYIDLIPVDRVQQFHLAGHDNCGDYIVDTHDAAVVESVWQLYQYASKRFGQVSTLLERDDQVPALSVLQEELAHARQVFEAVQGQETTA